MILRFLGTGTSFGVPVIGCRCGTCTSTDPRDRRTRHAALVTEGGRRLLVDTPPELRLQLVDAGIDMIDALWFTHCHADHVHGLDDVRVFSERARAPIQVYAAADCEATLRDRFAYVFDPRVRPLQGTSKPEATLTTLHPYEPVEMAGMTVTPLPVPHGPLSVYGFRVGDLGYVTDGKSAARADGGRAAGRARAGAERALVRQSAPHALQRGRGDRGRPLRGRRAHVPHAPEPPRLARRARRAPARGRVGGV